MSESIALAKLMFARTRNQLIGWIAWMTTSAIIAVSVGALFDTQWALSSYGILTFPLFIWSLAMFELGNSTTTTEIQSGYSHWLLRMPIADWKLAYVPLAMRMIWLTMIYLFSLILIGWMTNIWLPVTTGLIGLWAAGAWVSTIAWRPFRGMWRRIGVVILACVLLYVSMMTVMSVHFDAKTDFQLLRDHPRLVKGSVALMTILAFASGIYLAMKSLTLARTNSLGLVAERHTKLSGWIGQVNAYLAPDASQPILHRSGTFALAWHDRRRMMLDGMRWFYTFGLIGCVLAIAVMPLEIVNALFVMIVLTQLGTISSNSMVEPTKKSGSSLPPYVAASPMTCAEIGFTRAANAIGAAYILLVCLGAAYLVSTWMPYNQRKIARWIEHQSSIYQDPMAAYRWMALIAMAVVAMVPSRSLAFTWPTMTGRSRLALTALTLPIIVFFGGIAAVTGWFITEAQAGSDWETVIAHAWYWASWIPTVLAVLLVIKLVASVIAAALTLQQKLIRPVTAVGIVVVWVIVTLALALVAHALIPDQRILFAWTLMVTAWLLPLGQLLVLPYAVYLNRYR